MWQNNEWSDGGLHQAIILRLVTVHMGYIPDGADCDLTASALIVEDESVLLILHKQLSQWLQPGGHIGSSETPPETAKREAKEETGLTIDFHCSLKPVIDSKESTNLPRPFNVNAHRIEDGHWHCDFAYLAVVTDTGDPTHAHEHEGMRWFNREELSTPTISDGKMQSDTRLRGLEAIQRVAEGVADD